MKRNHSLSGMVRWNPPDYAMPNPVGRWQHTPRGQAFITMLYRGMGDAPYSGLKRPSRRPSTPQGQDETRQALTFAYQQAMPVRVIPRGMQGIDAQTGKPVELTPLQRQRIGTATRLALTGPALANWRATNRHMVRDHAAITLHSTNVGKA